MTIEGAIQILNTVLIFGKCNCPHDEIIECLKMAIKALDNMRKYKQIKQILDMWNEFKYDDDELLAMISDIVYKD